MPPSPKVPWLRWAGAAALFAIVLLGAVAVVHRLPSPRKAMQLWSEKDLPALPTEQQNGWILFHSAAAKLGDDERPNDLRDLEQLDWPRVKALAHAIRQFTADPTVRSQVAAARDALASPRFADACPLDLEVPKCEHLEMMRLHDVLTVGALADALSGNWDEALVRAASLLRADVEMMRTSRTAVSALTARRMVRKDLRCVAMLFDGIESEGRGRVSDRRARLAQVASVLELAARSDTAPARAVIAEYVYVTNAITRLSDLTETRLGGDWITVLFLDRDRTIGLANTYFEALMRFAESPSTREPPVRRGFSRERLDWWLYNAGGKMQLDLLFVDLAPALREIDKQDRELAAASNALRMRAGEMTE